MTGSGRPARVPGPLFAAAGYFLPRLMFLRSSHAPQIGWGDIAQALDGFPCDDLDLASAGFWDEWRRRWEAQADRYLTVEKGATTAVGRARALRGAAACYHWAEFMYFDDPGHKTELRRRVRDCFQRSLEGGDLEVVPGELPAGPGSGSPDVSVPYWLLLPPAHRRPPGRLPCVVMSNGLDSMTEVEVLALAETYLERGIAALLFDGPGQGVHLGRTPLRVDMETVVAGLVARLREDPRIDGDRLAFFGISFGGYFALRVAQRLGESFRCVVNASGGPRPAPFAGLPRRLKDDFRFALTGGGTASDAADAAQMQRRFDDLALDPSVPPGTRVLSVHGALDDIFPLSGLTELDQAWGAAHLLVTHPDEAHVCLNLIGMWSQQAADWVAGHLLLDLSDDDRRTENPS